MSKPNHTDIRASVPPTHCKSEEREKDTTSYFLLKKASAKKLGKYSSGQVHYQILSDIGCKHLSLAIVGNDGGGYFSREVVPFEKVEACLAAHERTARFPSKVFATAFTGRSSNNAGFLAAILRSEGLLSAAPETESQHAACGDRSTWKATLLSQSGKEIVLSLNTSSSRDTSIGMPGSPDEQAPARQTLSLKRAKPEPNADL